MTLGKAAAGARRRSSVVVRVTADELPNQRVYQRSSGSTTLVLSGSYTGTASAVAARVIVSDTSAEVVPWTTVWGGAGASGENFTDATGARPVAWWMFTESSGNRASGAGTGNVLVPSASVPALAIGPQAQSAVDFVKASTQQFNLPESGMSTGFPGRSTAANGSITVGAWIRIDSETGSDAGVLGKETNWQLVVEGNSVQFRVFATGNTAAASSADTSVYQSGVWKHYVGRWTAGSGETVLYVNGIKMAAATQTPAVTARNASTGDFTVGTATFKSNFDGGIAELFVFDVALSDTQIASIYSSGLDGTRSATITTVSEFSSEFSTEFMPPSGGGGGTLAPGSWSGSLSIPQGGWYKLQYRLATEPTGVFTAANMIGVGDVWMFAGESQQARMSTLVSSPPTPDSRTVYVNPGPTWNLPGVVAGTGGNGVIRFLNVMRAATNVPQACLQVSVEGTSITDWEIGDAAYTTALSRLSSVGTIAGFLWNQGGTGIGVVTKADYKTRLASLRTGMQGAGTIQRFAVFPLMNRLSAADSDLNTQEMRRAHYEFIAENNGVVNLGWLPDVALADDVTQTAAGSEQIAYTYAHALLYAMGVELTNNLGPTITAATRSGTAVTLTVQHKSGTGLKLNNGTVATGFQVFPRGATHSDVSALTVSGVSLAASAITLTLAANPASAVDVYYQYGRFDAASPVYDNSTAATLNRTVGNALQPLMSPIQSPVETGGFINPAIKFDASSALVRYSVNNVAAFNLPDADWTIGIFMRVDSNAGTTDQYMFSSGNYGTLNSYNFLLNEASGTASVANKFEFNIRGAGATAFTAQGPTNVALTDSTWRFWFIERVKPTETLNMYVVPADGTRTLYYSMSVLGLGAIAPTVAPALATRAPQAVGSGLWFDGAISSFFSMSGVLSQTQMQQMAAGADLIANIGRAPSVYTKLNTLTSPIANSGTAVAPASLIGGVVLTEGP